MSGGGTNSTAPYASPREARGKGFVSRQRQIQSDFRFHVPNPLGWTDIRNNSKIKSAAGR